MSSRAACDELDPPAMVFWRLMMTTATRAPADGQTEQRLRRAKKDPAAKNTFSSRRCWAWVALVTWHGG